MKYYVVADVHGFFTEMKKALLEAGFFDDTEPHILIVCGDMQDRGKETLEMQEFMLSLLEKGELIFIRGNHEDLLEIMLEDIEYNLWEFAMGVSYHISNGTWDTALRLAGMKNDDALTYYRDLIFKTRMSPFYKVLMRASKDYFETEHYIFVHGWIPAKAEAPAWAPRNKSYSYNPDWRRAGKNDWLAARWYNGMDLAKRFGVTEPGKTIVCGHYHVSWAHSKEGKGSEWGEDACFEPYRAEGIIALDACTSHSGKVNCIVIED
ncbi:MAG: metallophosphoesterase [Clostridia bacterium]|nr:metallophosphoesterase [Clostridia bacterium]